MAVDNEGKLGENTYLSYVDNIALHHCTHAPKDTEWSHSSSSDSSRRDG